LIDSILSNLVLCGRCLTKAEDRYWIKLGTDSCAGLHKISQVQKGFQLTSPFEREVATPRRLRRRSRQSTDSHIKLFVVVNDTQGKQARVFVPCKHLQPCLIFVGAVSSLTNLVFDTTQRQAP